MAAKKPRAPKPLPLPADELMEFTESPAAPQPTVKAPTSPVEALSSLVESPVSVKTAPEPQKAEKPAPAVLPQTGATCVHCGAAVANPVRVRRVAKSGEVTWETYAPGHRSDRRG